MFRSAIIQIQRLVRGYFGRKIAIEYQEVEAMKFHIYYLGYFALQIQRCYRGHRVRRHILDFHARKRFLEGAASRGEELKRQLENYADQCIKVGLLIHIYRHILYCPSKLAINYFTYSIL